MDEIIALESPKAGKFPYDYGLSREQIQEIESVVDDYINGGLTARKHFNFIAAYINKKFDLDVSISTWRRFRDDRKGTLGV